MDIAEIKPDEIEARWEDLILPPGLKDSLERSILLSVETFGKPRDHGVILFGPPGTGKTTIPYAIAKKLGWTLYYISPKDFAIPDGNLEYAIKLIFQLIEKKYKKIKDEIKEEKKKGIEKDHIAKIVFVFDEIDEFVVSRGDEKDRQTRLMTTLMLPLLNNLRNDAEDCGFIFFALTNNIKRFDPAITRKGRFDLILSIGPPSRLDRYHIFKKIIKKIQREYEKQGIAVIDWKRNERGGIESSIDLNTLSSVSERLGFGDIEIICRRVVEERLALNDQGFRDYIRTKQKRKGIPPFTVRLKTFRLLRWINKLKKSNKDVQEAIDQFYMDSILYSRGSSPNTELDQIQIRVDREFNSLIINYDLDYTDFSWKINKPNDIWFELVNMNEINTFIGKLTIELNGVGYKKKRLPPIRALVPANIARRFLFHVKPTRKGPLEINFKIEGGFVLKGMSVLENNIAYLSGSITRTKKTNVS